MAVNTETSRHCVHHMGSEYNRLLAQVTSGRNELTRPANSRIVPGFSDGRKAADPATAILAGFIADGPAAQRNSSLYSKPSIATATNQQKNLLQSLHKNASAGTYKPDLFEMMQTKEAKASALLTHRDDNISESNVKTGYFAPNAYTQDADDGYGYTGRASSYDVKNKNYANNVRIDNSGIIVSGKNNHTSKTGIVFSNFKDLNQKNKTASQDIVKAAVASAQATVQAAIQNKSIRTMHQGNASDANTQSNILLRPATHGLRQMAKLAGATDESLRMRDDSENFLNMHAMTNKGLKEKLRTASGLLHSKQGDIKEQILAPNIALTDPLGAICGTDYAVDKKNVNKQTLSSQQSMDDDDDAFDLELVNALDNFTNPVVQTKDFENKNKIVQSPTYSKDISVIKSIPIAYPPVSVVPSAGIFSLNATTSSSSSEKQAHEKAHKPTSAVGIELSKLLSIPLHNRSFAESQKIERLTSTILSESRARSIGSSSQALKLGAEKSQNKQKNKIDVKLNSTTSGHGVANVLLSQKPSSLSSTIPLKTLNASESNVLFASLLQESIHAEEGHAHKTNELIDKMERAEKVDDMAAARSTIVTRTVPRWFCADCEKWFDTAPTMCQQDAHAVTVTKKLQYQFACKNCGRRSTSFEKLYFTPCTNCSKVCWEAASIYGKASSDKIDGTPMLLPTGEKVMNSLRGSGTSNYAHEMANTDDVVR
jgi:Mcm10 replication factor